MDTRNQISPASYKKSVPDESTKAAVKVQKVYRSYRTRRRLADSVLVAENLWWSALEYAESNHSTISFFDVSTPETAAERWGRISRNASKVGKGSCKDDKARKLAFDHWIEAIDPRHRYGHNLNIYYGEWSKRNTEQPFFYWLDVGHGKGVDLVDCPRSRLRQECIKYLGPQEREDYEYEIVEGRVVHKLTGDILDTTEERKNTKWIFVMSTSRKLYAGKKKKGLFHHSSFLAGGTTVAAGRLTAQEGKLNSVSAYSGHYRPDDENLNTFLDFLRNSSVNLEGVEVVSPKEDYESKKDYERCDSGNLTHRSETGFLKPSEQPTISAPNEESKHKGVGKQTLSIDILDPEVSHEEILKRVKSKQECISCQLGDQLSLKFATGSGPRVECASDYPYNFKIPSSGIGCSVIERTS